MGLLTRLRGKSLTPVEAAAGLDEGTLTLVDVREPVEYASGHAPGAEHVPLSRLAHELPRLAALDRPVAFVCQSGARSARATRVARAAGVDAANVRGGMMAWGRRQLPVVRGGGGRGRR